jgi:hypothetical protein
MSDEEQRRVYVMVDGERRVGVVDPKTNVITVDASPGHTPKKGASRRASRIIATRLAKEALDLQHEIVEQTSSLKDVTAEIDRRRIASTR